MGKNEEAVRNMFELMEETLTKSLRLMSFKTLEEMSDEDLASIKLCDRLMDATRDYAISMATTLDENNRILKKLEEKI